MSKLTNKRPLQRWVHKVLKSPPKVNYVSLRRVCPINCTSPLFSRTDYLHLLLRKCNSKTSEHVGAAVAKSPASIFTFSFSQRARNSGFSSVFQALSAEPITRRLHLQLSLRPSSWARWRRLEVWLAAATEREPFTLSLPCGFCWPYSEFMEPDNAS